MKDNQLGRYITDTFDVIYVINLSKRKDRLRDISKQLARIGLHFDGDRVVRLDACSFDSRGDYPTAGTRGCFHSHLKAWQYAMRKPHVQSALVLEDDLDFVRDIRESLPAAFTALAERDWSIFYGSVLRWAPSVEIQAPLTEAMPGEAILGGHFVGMRGEALKTVSDYLDGMDRRPRASPEGGPMHVDGAYNWFRSAHPEYQTLIARPDLGLQRSSRTDIHELTWKDRLPVVRDVTALGRRVVRAIR